MGKSHTNRTMLVGIFVSPEIAGALVGVGLAFWRPGFVVKVGDLFTQGWQMYFLVGLPLGGSLLGFKTLRSLLHPKDAEEKGFYKWPGYHLLRYYGYIPIALCIIAAATTLFFLIAPQSLSRLQIGAIYLAVSLAWMLSIITLGMASLRIDVLLGGAD